jgi:hypothetical protein
VSVVEHERAWSWEPELRRQLEDTRLVLTEYAALLGTARGVPDLRAAIPAPTTPCVAEKLMVAHRRRSTRWVALPS